MKITDEVKNQFIATKFEQKVLFELELSREVKAKVKEAIKIYVLQKREQ